MVIFDQHMVIFHSSVEFPEGDHLRAQASASAEATARNAAVGVLQGHWAESSTWRSQGRDLEVTPRKTPKNDGETFSWYHGDEAMDDLWIWTLLDDAALETNGEDDLRCECHYVSVLMCFFWGGGGDHGWHQHSMFFFLLWGSAWQLLH